MTRSTRNRFSRSIDPCFTACCSQRTYSHEPEYMLSLDKAENDVDYGGLSEVRDRAAPSKAESLAREEDCLV